MSMSDPIADMLTRMRNAIMAQQKTVECPASRLKLEICRVLRDQGFIKDFELLDEAAPSRLRIALKYMPDRSPVLQGVRRVSRPSLRVYVRHNDIKPVRSGLGIAIISTSNGVMTGKDARKAGVGGEVICEVW